LVDKHWDSVRVSFGVTLFDHQVTANDISPIRQTLTQSGDTHFGARRAAPDVTDARYRALLRARGERPREG
jgi:hypothetical protein